jgi:hypothetical protein
MAQEKELLVFRSYGLKLFSGLLVGAAFFCFSGRPANAATFELNPISGTFTANSRFTVEVLVDTNGQAINSAEGTISFDTRYLSVEKIATDVSIFRFWVKEPIFSNPAGTISFLGGLPSPGYLGANGKVLKITFLASGAGKASVKFTDGSILANDGLGTNILSASQEGVYTIKTQSDAVESAVEKPAAPAVLVVTSPTHPDENGWYSAKDFRANWNLPGGGEGINYAFFSNPGYVLPAQSKGLAKEADYDLGNLKDGIWYFFVRLKMADGWGPVVVRSVKVDREPPTAFGVIRTDLNDPTEPQPTFHFETTDKTSGIASYEAKIDGGEWQIVPAGDYKLSPVSPGDHRLTVRAYDYAKNYAEAVNDFSVQSISPPVVETYSQVISSFQQSFVASGRAGTNMRVFGSLKRGSDVYNFEAVTDGLGGWRADFSDRFPTGDYQAVFYAKDSRGAVSQETGPLAVRVEGRLQSALGMLGEYTIIIIGAVVAVVLIYLVAVFSYSKAVGFRRRFLKDVVSFEEKIRKNRAKSYKPPDKLLRDIKELEEDLTTDIKKAEKE